MGEDKHRKKTDSNNQIQVDTLMTNKCSGKYKIKKMIIKSSTNVADKHLGPTSKMVM